MSLSKPILIGLGVLFVGLGVVGIVLPVVPTTPFLIVAAACFAKSSPRLHRWLLANRVFGPVLRNWQETRSIPRRAKWLAVIMVLCVGTLSFIMLENLLLKLLLVVLLALPLAFVIRLPVTESLSATGNRKGGGRKMDPSGSSNLAGETGSTESRRPD